MKLGVVLIGVVSCLGCFCLVIGLFCSLILRFFLFLVFFLVWVIVMVFLRDVLIWFIEWCVFG